MSLVSRIVLVLFFHRCFCGMCFTRVQYDEGWASKKGDQEFGPILRKQKNGGSIGKDMD